MQLAQRISPCLWFDTQAEEAARFYTDIFPNGRLLALTRYGEVGQEAHQQPVGSVMTVSFELDGLAFIALNGGPALTFSEAISFQVLCASQEEVDYYWERLGAGGDPAAQQCGWLKDRYGLSWQIVPAVLLELLRDPDVAKVQRVTEVMLQMQKLEIAALLRAAEGSAGETIAAPMTGTR